MSSSRLTLIMIALCAICAASHAQTPAPENGATWYQQAINQYQSFAELSPQDRDLIFNYDPAQPPSPELRAVLARTQPILEQVRRGAMQEYADFQLDYNQGIEMMLPHLGQMRGIARLMSADAMVRLHDGDASGASTRLADMYRMSGHFGDDRVIISSLVGNAVFSLTDQSVQRALDRGLLGADESAVLVGALGRLGTTDPFAYIESVMGEQEIMVNYLQNQAASPEGLQKLASLMGGDNGMLEDSPLLFMSQEQFEDEIGVYDQTMSRVVEIFSNPDRAAAKEQMKALDEEIEGMVAGARMGGQGALVAMLLPALTRVLDRMIQSEATVAERLAMLNTLAAGKARPEEFANAAVWYMRGIEMLEKLNADELAALRAFAADTSAPMPEELANALAAPAVQDIIAVFMEGSGKRRCDFTFARVNRSNDLIPPYAPGMHDGFRLLYADAIRRLNSNTAEQPWEVVDRFATCLRMCGHMSSDPIMVSSLIAHHNFEKTIVLLEAAFTANALPAESKPSLFDALERSGRRDPFGYIGALVATRTALADQLSRLYSPLDPSADPEEFAARRAKLAESVKALNGDQLLYLLAIINTMQRNAAAGSTAPGNVAASGSATTAPAIDANASHDAMVRRLADVISYHDLQAAQQDVTIIAPALAQGTLDVLAERTIPAIAASRLAGNFGDHARRARNDLRRASNLLRPDAKKDAKEDEGVD